MLSTRKLILGAAVLVTTVTVWSVAPAASASMTLPTRRYEVTITNVTKGQIFAPAIVASHNSNFSLFELGAAASPELAFLAEEGSPMLLAGALDLDPDVRDVRTAGGMLHPGETTTIFVLADDAHSYLSLAGMAVSTNDGFLSLRSIPLPSDSSKHFARLYDAGSEYNSEACAFVPGPPCGSAMSHDPTPAEGYVRIHEGIHGLGGLAPETYDWRGEVAEIEIRQFTN